VALNLIGNKVGMTQIFDKKGEVIPVTVIKGGPCIVTQIKSVEKCGYNAIQMGYLELSRNSRQLTKPMLGHFSKSNLVPLRHLQEFKVGNLEDYAIGQEFSVQMFKIGEKVNVSGLTIGKGNTGNIKQHNFQRGGMTHGSKHKRLQGSLGSGTTPGRTFPGKKMPGRSGMEKITIQGLEIVDIDATENLILLKGSIPGKAGNLITITLA
jgi:large subunit ribosomal protein L3